MLFTDGTARLFTRRKFSPRFILSFDVITRINREYTILLPLSIISLSRPPGSRFRVKLTRFRWQGSTRPFCRLSGTGGGEEDTGCTHQTPSLATLFNPLTPPLPLPSHCTLCMCNYDPVRKGSKLYNTALHRTFFFDSYSFSSLSRSFLSPFLYIINRLENFLNVSSMKNFWKIVFKENSDS